MSNESSTPESGRVLGAKARARARQELGRDETGAERLERLAMRCLELLEDDIESGAGRARYNGIQHVMLSWGRKPQKGGNEGIDPNPNETEEQRSQRLRALFRQAPPVLRKALLEWKKEEEARS
jgi:hypothetical protein